MAAIQGFTWHLQVSVTFFKNHIYLVRDPGLSEGVS